jgi:hypothetical protein
MTQEEEALEKVRVTATITARQLTLVDQYAEDQGSASRSEAIRKLMNESLAAAGYDVPSHSNLAQELQDLFARLDRVETRLNGVEDTLPDNARGYQDERFRLLEQRVQELEELTEDSNDR